MIISAGQRVRKTREELGETDRVEGPIRKVMRMDAQEALERMKRNKAEGPQRYHYTL